VFFFRFLYLLTLVPSEAAAIHQADEGPGSAYTDRECGQERGSRVIEGNDKLVGTWKLISASSTTSKGQRSDTPYGVNPSGLLTYTEDGRVSALISHGGRRLLPPLATTEQQADAFKTFLAYAGRYAISGDKVIHSVEVSSIQSFVGKDLVRFVKFHGDQIILVTPPTPMSGKIRTVELIWQRLAVDS